MLEEMIWWGQQTDQNLTLDFGLGESKELDIASNKNNIWAAVEDFLEEDLAFCVCPTEFVVYLEPTDWNTQAIGDPKKIKWKKNEHEALYALGDKRNYERDKSSCQSFVNESA